MRLFFRGDDLETLNLRIQVSGMRSFDEDAKDLITDNRVCSSLTIDQESTLLRGVNVANLALVVRIGEAAVIFDDIWRVSIRASNLRQCVSAMTVLLNAMTEEMDLTVSIAVVEVEGSRDLTLPDALRRSDQRERNEELMRVGAGVLASGIFSLIVGYLLAGGA